MKGGVTPSNVIPGDKVHVLVNKNRENKLDTSFKPEPVSVKAKRGNSVILDYKGRNVTHETIYRTVVS